MKLTGIFTKKGSEIDLIKALQHDKESLLEENKSLKDAISPLTKLGFNISEIKGILDPYAAYIKTEIDKEVQKNKSEAVYHGHGASASSAIGTR